MARLRTQVRQLQAAVAHWQTRAVIARADAEHHARLVERLRTEAQRRPHEGQPARTSSPAMKRAPDRQVSAAAVLQVLRIAPSSC
jgi:hypothetical protein